MQGLYNLEETSENDVDYKTHARVDRVGSGCWGKRDLANSSPAPRYHCVHEEA